MLRADAAGVRAEHKILSQARDPKVGSAVWSSLFESAPVRWCSYDDTAKRMDKCLMQELTQLSKENAGKEAEAIAIAHHLTNTLSTEVHPFGVVVHQFKLYFEQQYCITPILNATAPGAATLGAPVAWAAQLLKNAVDDLSCFLMSFKSFICTVLSDCLTTRSRKIHAHAVLLDVVFPLCYDILWSLYCTVRRVVCWQIRSPIVSFVDHGSTTGKASSTTYLSRISHVLAAWSSARTVAGAPDARDDPRLSSYSKGMAASAGAEAGRGNGAA